jgi:hypothetical protein
MVGISTSHPIAEEAFCGSGTTNFFRQLKPGLMDNASDLSAPLRWSLFVEPLHAWRGGQIKFEAVLANEDILQPGTYPVRLQLIGPGMMSFWEKTIPIEIPASDDKMEPPYAQLVYTGEITADVPSGKYRFLATLLNGADTRNDETEFYISDPAEMPPVDFEVVLWGEDEGLHQWLSGKGIRTKAFTPGTQTARQVILVSNKLPESKEPNPFEELVKQIARGSAVIFLDPAIFSDGENPTRWLPLQQKGVLGPIDFVGGYFRADSWSKIHPIFEDLPCGGIMDPTFYRNLVPNQGLLHCYTVPGRTVTQDEKTADLDRPVEAVCGANRLSFNYASGLHLAVYELGAGRFILNTLLIRQYLGQDPAAERLLRNMLRYATQNINEPVMELPDDFDPLLKCIGYR